MYELLEGFSNLLMLTRGSKYFFHTNEKKNTYKTVLAPVFVTFGVP